MATEGRLAVVTGASRGLGHAAALHLAKQGVHIIAVARTVGGLEDLDDAITEAGGTATLVPLDLTDHDAIDRLGGSISERWGKLDMLLCAAATVGAVTPLSQNKPTMFEPLFALNVTANYRLLRSLHPLLKLSEAGRVVALTCGGTNGGRAYLGPYTASKRALDVLIQSYAAENRTNTIRANLLDPGPHATRLRRQIYPGENADALPPPEAAAAHIAHLLEADITETGQRFAVEKGKLTTSG